MGVLLRSDGTAVACGDNGEGQCRISPSTFRGEDVFRFRANPGLSPVRRIVLQAVFNGYLLKLLNLCGEVLYEDTAAPTERLVDLQRRLSIQLLGILPDRVIADVAMPGGAVLGIAAAHEPTAVLGQFLTASKRRRT